jgi:hypothetical protein
MCDERERLLEYVYGESAPADRLQIEAHLTDCHVCRAEISGLRGVRDELLAWDVPSHEPIWRPIGAAPVISIRRVFPTWALAAAAGLVFTAGLAGGLAVRGVDPLASGEVPAPAQTTASSSSAPGLSPASTTGAAVVTTADLARMEAAILERVRSEFEERIRSASASQRPQAPAMTRVSTGAAGADPDLLARRVAALESWMDNQISLNAIFDNKFGRLNRSTSNLSEQVELSRMQRVSLETGAR